MDIFAHYNSPLGDITVASSDAALIGLWFNGQRHFGETTDSESPDIETSQGEPQKFVALPSVLTETFRWLDLYFGGGIPDFTPPIALRGSKFRLAVWSVLQTIPYGRTMTYGDIAQRLMEEYGFPKVSARAVGGAVGHNPISLIVPCHRVVGAGGALTGYAGGLERKRWLLEREELLDFTFEDK